MRAKVTDHDAHAQARSEAKPIDPALGAVAEINRMQHVLRDVGSNIATAEEAIERERSLLQATVQAMPIGVLLVTPEGRIALVNFFTRWLISSSRIC